MASRVAGVLAALVAFPFCGDACAEDVVATIAPSAISIDSNYTGSSIVVFGAITNGQLTRSYDAVVTVNGPLEDLVVRRKERVLGIWINRSSRTYSNVPSFIAVFANRPFDAIIKPESVRPQKLGLRYNVFPDKAVDENDPFEQNLIRARIDEGHYIEQLTGVSFVSPTVFRTEIRLPTNALTGIYGVDVKVFSGGALVAQTKTSISVDKIGVAEFVAKSSLDHSFLYGMTALGVALLTGWLSSVAFRRG
jgi:uncharacterized protein (TIGR02186 family)